MDGSVRVLLVSAGASPDALVAELERLGVQITPCSFADAEEHLESDPPDLVALAGALGAVELANMIDDLDDGPRMVIVAERKELAKLRGLNREVVVSLFAMETTEKVVGQRIESLARRAARRRDHKAAETAPVNKTSLGLPTAAQVGKVELKKGEAPPRSRPPQISEQVPPSSGKHPGAEPTEQKTPEAARAPSVEQANAAPEVPEAPAVPLAQSAPAGDTAATDHAAPQAREKVDAASQKILPEAEPRATPPLPQRGAKALSAKEEAERSIMVIDEDLLESILPDPPAGEIPEISILSMLSIIPDPEEAPVSHPPTLPPQAKAQGADFSALKLSAAPEELDIGSSESALENLESVKLEITQELVEHAQKEMSEGSAAPKVAESPLLPEAAGESQERPTDETSEAESGVQTESRGDSAALDQTIAFSDLKASIGELGNDEPTKVSEMEDPEMRHLLADLGEPKVARSESAAAPAGDQKEAPEVRKGGGAKAYALVAFVGVTLFGVYAVQSGMMGGRAPASPAGEQSAATEKTNDAQSGEVANTASPAEAQGEQEAASALAQEAPKPEPDTPKAQEQGGEEGHAETRGAAAMPLENPFKREEAQALSCEALLAGEVPQKGPDPVSEASAVWDEARAAIVGGKLNEAHRFMCQAVSINPESAAVEGLAAHYLILGSYSQALRWANEAEALRPGQKDIRNLLGDVYAMTGDVAKARDTWLELLNIGPEEVSRIAPISKDYSVEAGRHLRRGDLARAEVFYRRAVILDPENLNGLLGLAKVYHRLEMPRYTRAFCDMTLKLSDVIPEVHVLLGELSLSEGNKEEARARFERALAVRPDFFPAKRGLSQVK